MSAPLRSDQNIINAGDQTARDQSGSHTPRSTESGLDGIEQKALQAAHAAMSSFQHGFGNIKEAIVGQDPIQRNDQAQIHKDGTDYIKKQLEAKSTDTDKLTMLPVAGESEAGSGVKEVGNWGTPSDPHPRHDRAQFQDQGQIHKDGTDYIKQQLESKQTDTERHTMLPVVGRSSNGSAVKEVGNWGSTSDPHALSSDSATQHNSTAEQYPRIGTAQVGPQPHQTESIPPVLVPKHGPEPGKGVAPIEGSHPSEKAAQEVSDLPRQAERSARAGSINPVETNAGEGLSAPPILPDDEIDEKDRLRSGESRTWDTFGSAD